jgi:hypothetical protein
MLWRPVALSLTHNLDRPILEISGFRYVDPGTAPGLNCLALKYNLLIFVITSSLFARYCL